MLLLIQFKEPLLFMELIKGPIQPTSKHSQIHRGLRFHPTLWPTAINEKSARGSDDDAVTLERPMNYGT